MKANITDIKRFAVHDGDGIRTTVFFKGCPMKCAWCHNPETISAKRQLGFFEHKCTLCGRCASVCSCHKTKGGRHVFERESCSACGKCAAVCPAEALEIFGEEMECDALLDILVRDKSFYESSGGGVTLSGGECLLQADFCTELLKKLKDAGISTAVDTCGYVPQSSIQKVMPFADIFLYDIKAIDRAVHVSCTGMPNEIILENLKYIDGCGKRSEIRIPYVPGFNDNQIEKIGEFLAGLKHVSAVRVLPYHNYAASKYAALGMENTLPPQLPGAEEIRAAEEALRKFGLNC